MTYKEYTEKHRELRGDNKGQSALHRAYFAQYISQSILLLVKQKIGMEAIAKSKAPHMNDIPLKKWDEIVGYNERENKFTPSLTPLVLRSQIIKNGETLSPATLVCILKEAARQLKPQAERELAQT